MLIVYLAAATVVVTVLAVHFAGLQLVRWVAVPLGWVRGAHALGRLSLSFHEDMVGGALFLAAWAHLRSRRLEDRTWLAGQLATLSPLGGGGIAAKGLLAAAQDDLPQARTWLRSLAWVPTKVVPDICLVAAREWLAAEAASRGAWSEVIAVAERPGPSSRATRFLAAMATKMTGGSEMTGGSVSPTTLWLRWLLAPQRRAFLPLLRQALAPAAPPVPPPPRQREGEGATEGPYRTASAPPVDPLQRALAAHARVILAPTATALAEAATAWDGIVLALPAAMREGALTDLASLASTHRLTLPEGNGFSDDVRREVRRELLGELETVSRALESRVSAGRIHDAFAEWGTFVELRRMYDEAGSLAGREAQRLVYAHVHDALCPLAVILWNQRKEHPLAHAMFRWLLDEARLTDHASLISHEEKNVACRF